MMSLQQLILLLCFGNHSTPIHGTFDWSGRVSTQQYPVTSFVNRLLMYQSVMAPYAASLGNGWSLPTCMCSTQHFTYAQERYHH